jgi:hypothetical protein
MASGVSGVFLPIYWRSDLGRFCFASSRSRGRVIKDKDEKKHAKEQQEHSERSSVFH